MSHEDKKRGQAQKAEKRAAALRENLLRRKAAGQRATGDTDKNKESEKNDPSRN